MRVQIQYDSGAQRFSIRNAKTKAFIGFTRSINVVNADLVEVENGKLCIEGVPTFISGLNFSGQVDPQTSLQHNQEKEYNRDMMCKLSIDSDGYVVCHCQTGTG